MWQLKLKQFVGHPLFHGALAGLILINAVILGIKTYPSMMKEHGPLLDFLDSTIIWIFVAEIGLLIAANGWKFFKDPWHVFDFTIVALALIPANTAISVLRAVRALRILLLVDTSASLRRITASLFAAIPGISGIAALLAILFYVFGIMATMLYGAQYPQFFGSLHAAFFSLFQIMTLEGWPDIVRTIMQTHPYSWVFFVTYILIATYSILNLFIAVIIDAMEKQYEEDLGDDRLILENIQNEIKLLRTQIDDMTK